tara:strand:- start:92 stop:1057 length:966 start_codon:yes stop_codon:yes gene_type:complete
MIAGVITVYLGQINNIPFSAITIVFFSLFRIVPIIAQILQGKTNISTFIPAYDQIQDLKNEAKVLKRRDGTLNFASLNDSIRFKNVTFSYPQKEPVLIDLSLTIKKGDMTAFIGQSGSGKTTIVDLILGLYHPQNGCIKVDANELSEISINSFRQKIGYVPQEPELFNMSIKDNLMWSNHQAKESDIWNACKLANADKFINKLPDKLETILGDRGVRLSGGQRQRLSLARALIRNPDILILDEATSSLDTESEKLIQSSIDGLAGDITVIIIAHRISTIKNADMIYVLESGVVVEKGTYDSLTSLENGVFTTIINNQDAKN